MNLNLARKWRSKNFDTIAGQALSIKMLKNSLYLGQFFPVYLFSGQRGCGKTTTARVFAAAINCDQLAAFQSNPKKSPVPCLICASCLAMARGNHPDFIEMDAASHTGVDDVRAIIEAASLLPVLGAKKVYLIDEAHMLSKAAFNALLKILEEPPRSVLFMLATTDPHKIINTVMSRCFQLSFKAVDEQSLLPHLQAVCAAEQIRYAPGGLELVIQSTEGSVRDALNLVEQVRFSGGVITPEGVRAVLGSLSDEQALRLFEIVLHRGPRELLLFMQQEQFSNFSPAAICKALIGIVRAALWARYGVPSRAYVAYQAQLQQLVSHIPAERLYELAQILSEHEILLMRTTAQHELVEFLLLRMCKNGKSDDTPGSAGAPSTPPGIATADVSLAVCSEGEEEDDENEEEDEEDIAGVVNQAPWDLFLSDVTQLQDPLLNSIFTQGVFVSCVEDSGVLEVCFSKELVFFKDCLENAKKSWLPLMQKHFGQSVSFLPVFTGSSSIREKKIDSATNTSGDSIVRAGKRAMPGSSGLRSEESVKKTSTVAAGAARQGVGFGGQSPEKRRSGGSFAQSRSAGSRVAFGSRAGAKKEQVIDISDKTVWARATLLNQYFPGTFTEVEERVEGQV